MQITDQDRQNLAQVHQLHARVLAQLPPPHAFQGRGIVTSIYDKEFASGWVLLCELARLGCTLPLEVFHAKGELSPAQVALLEQAYPHTTVRCFAEDGLKGFPLKVMAMFQARFEEILWLDSDDFPIREPSFLFDDPEYVEKGSLFWRDVCGADRAGFWHAGAPVWEVFEVPSNDAEEFETGQLLIHKTRCWPELCLTLHINRNHGFYYRFMYGDKDTFRMAWWHLHVKRGGQMLRDNALTGPVPYGFMPYGPFHVGRPNPWKKWGGGSVMVQRDREGEPLFNHRNLNKWRVDSAFDGRHDTPQDPIYLQHLERLRGLLRYPAT